MLAPLQNTSRPKEDVKSHKNASSCFSSQHHLLFSTAMRRMRKRMWTPCNTHRNHQIHRSKCQKKCREAKKPRKGTGTGDRKGRSGVALRCLKQAVISFRLNNIIAELWACRSLPCHEAARAKKSSKGGAFLWPETCFELVHV